MTEPVPEGVVVAPVSDGRLDQAAAVLREVLRLADVPATLDVKDSADGGISIAVALGAELPGVALGRRGTFVEALQFLVNKLTHRPGSARRWVSLGLGDHPAPRLPRPVRAAPEAPASRPAPRQAAPVASVEPPRPPAPSPVSVEAVAVDVSEDVDLTLAARALAEASAATGRFYGVLALSADDRARMLRAVADISGVRAVVEGEGRLRRLVLTPDRPVPMPRKVHPLGIEDEAVGTDGAGG